MSRRYLELFFRTSITLLVLYLGGVFVFAFASDVGDKVSGYSTGPSSPPPSLSTSSSNPLDRAEIRQEILHCSAQYHANRCHPPEQRTAYTEAACQGWEHCMNRDPNVVGRARVGAETFGEVVTGFVDALSWKTSVRWVSLTFLDEGSE